MKLALASPTLSALPRRLTPGFSDGLGERLLTFEDAASPLELLRFKRELADAPGFESALRDRVEKLERFHHPAVAVVRRVDWIEEERLVLVSKHTAGRRLSERLAGARGPVVAQEFLRQITPVLAALQASGDGVVHGALAPERIVVGQDGRFVVVEHVLGSALHSLRFSPSRWRSELGIAVPPGHFVGLNSRNDVIQLGFVALSVLLGRRLDPADYPEQVVALLDESAQSDAGMSWASSRLRSWLERTLQVGRRAFGSASEACEALGELPSAAQLHATESHHSTALTVPLTAPFVEVPPADPDPVTSVLAPPPQDRSLTPHAATIDRPTDTSAARSTGPAGRISAAGWVAAGLAGLSAAEAVVIVSLLYAQQTNVVAEASPPRVERQATGAAVQELPPMVSASTPPFDAPASADALVPKPAVPDATSSGSSPAADAGAADRAARMVERFGGIRVSSAIELQVYEAGQLIGSTAGPMALNEGSHTFDLVNESLGYRSRTTANIRAGQMTSLSVPLPSGRININAVPWADVVIDGNPAGQTPLANLSIPIGQHEIVFRHPQLGEQRQTAVVKFEGLTRVSVNLQR